MGWRQKNRGYLIPQSLSVMMYNTGTIPAVFFLQPTVSGCYAVRCRGPNLVLQGLLLLGASSRDCGEMNDSHENGKNNPFLALLVSTFMNDPRRPTGIANSPVLQMMTWRPRERERMAGSLDEVVGT